jgi:hypothetical protein
MVGKLRPEVKHLKDLTGVKGGGPPPKAELLHNSLLKPDRARLLEMV